MKLIELVKEKKEFKIDFDKLVAFGYSTGALSVLELARRSKDIK